MNFMFRLQILVCLAGFLVAQPLCADQILGTGDFSITDIDTEIVPSGEMTGSFTFTIDVDPAVLISAQSVALNTVVLNPAQVRSTSYDLSNFKMFFFSNPEDGGGLGTLHVSLGGTGGPLSLPSSIVQGVDDFRLTYHAFPKRLPEIENGPVVIDANGAVFTKQGQSGFFNATVQGSLVLTLVSENEPPTADAGADQSIRAGDPVFLDGSASFDDNTASAALDYSWGFFSKPESSTATLDDATSAMPSFVADVEGTYTLQLIVTDEEGAPGDPSFVEISSDNLAPTAMATVQSSLVVIDNPAQFDGTGSSDPEMDSLTYSWSITAAPATSAAVLDGAATATPTLTPDREGVYQISLTVSDFLGPGAPTVVELTATTASGFAEIAILDACDQVNALTAGQVTTKGNQNAFCKHLANAIGDLQEGLVGDAIDKLNKAIGRTDGYPLRGSPDGNGPSRDWITDCDAQTTIYDLLNLAVDTLEN